MADVVTVDNGALTDYAVHTDEVSIGGTLAHVQRMKLVDGSDGGTTLIGGDATGLYVGGGVASGAADAGNPIKIGGRYNVTPPTLADTQRGDIQLDSRANQRTALYAGDSINKIQLSAFTDGHSGSIGIPAGIVAFNNTTYDRIRGDITFGLDVDVTRIQDAFISGAVDAVDEAVTLVVIGRETALIHVTGTWVGTLTFEGTIDGTNWIGITALGLNGTTTYGTTTANGQFIVNCGGFSSIRLRINPYTSGTANIAIRAGGGLRWPEGKVFTEPISSALYRIRGYDNHDSPAELSAVLIGAYGSTAEPTATSTDGDLTRLWTDRFGRLFTNSRITGSAGEAIAAEGGLMLVAARGRTDHDAVPGAGDDRPVPIGGIGVDTTPADVSAVGDVVRAWFNRKGALYTRLFGGDGTAYVFPSGALSVLAAGIDAHDGVLTQNPIPIGGLASSAAPADVSGDGDAVRAWFDRKGRLNTRSLIQDLSNNVMAVDASGWIHSMVRGALAHDDVATAPLGNPLVFGGVASAAIPADVSADGDIVRAWLDRKGRLFIRAPTHADGTPVHIEAGLGSDGLGVASKYALQTIALPLFVNSAGTLDRIGVTKPLPVNQAPHLGLNSDPWNLVHEAARYTTTQTSAVLITGAAGEKIVVTKVQIQAGGTTPGELQLYFGTGAFVRGTNRAIFDGEFAPSATHKPGVIMDGPFIAGTNGDDLMVTTSAAINPLTINIWYYVVT